MRALSVEETGPPSVLQLRDVPKPPIGVGEARVRVHAAGVNFADVVMRRGHIPSPLPMIPGVEGAGIVEEVGVEVRNDVSTMRERENRKFDTQRFTDICVHVWPPRFLGG